MWKLLCCGVLLWVCALAAGASPLCVPAIDDLPAMLDAEYNLEWSLQVMQAPAVPLVIDVETGGRAGGYTLLLGGGYARWRADHPADTEAACSVPLSLRAGVRYQFSLKRRRGCPALLLDHHLLLTSLLPLPPQGTLRFRSVPGWGNILSARYHHVDRCQFGDDFMRTESIGHMLLNSPARWHDDLIWKTAYYQHDIAASAAGSEKREQPLANQPLPGLGESDEWLLVPPDTAPVPPGRSPNPPSVYPSRDQYFLQAGGAHRA